MSDSDIDIVQPTIVLFREEADGQEAEYVEIIEDSEERLVVKATFGMVDAVVENLEIEVISDGEGLIEVKEVSAVGSASGHVVHHADGDVEDPG